MHGLHDKTTTTTTTTTTGLSTGLSTGLVNDNDDDDDDDINNNIIINNNINNINNNNLRYLLLYTHGRGAHATNTYFHRERTNACAASESAIYRG